MTKRIVREVDAGRAHITTLRLVIVGLLLVVVLMWTGWKSAPADIRFHVPPDLRTGSVQRVGEVPPPNVYAFSAYIFQQLQYWPDNGTTDYPANIAKLQNYLTPSYQKFLADDFKRKASRGETQGRRRTVSELQGAVYMPERVEVVGNGSWIVYLDYETAEYDGADEVKRVKIRWPLHVVRMDVNPELNPWGLGLNGLPPGQFPLVLDEDQYAEASR